MKVQKLVIHNIGKVSDMEISLNKSLNLFYGEIRQGKTTILNAVKWCFGGSFPDDIIKEGEIEGFVHLYFDNGSIKREFYLGRDKKPKCRPIQYVVDGRVQSKPVEVIKTFLNPFSLDQNFFINKTDLEKKRYLVELLDIDTSEQDKAIQEVEDEAKVLRIEIKSFGEIDVTPVEPVDVSSLLEKQQEIQDEYEGKVASIKSFNQQASEINDKRDEAAESLIVIEEKIKLLTQQKAQLEEYLKNHPEYIEQKPIPEKPNTDELKQQIAEASETNSRYSAYKENLKKQKQKEDKKTELSLSELKIRKLRSEKLSLLRQKAEDSGVEGLSFNEDGVPLYNGKGLDMIATSEMMMLSRDLEKLYPEGFGIELIDRGESLGKSVFELVAKAKNEETTILVTIVGEKPSVTPEEVGVYVVEDGTLK